MVRFVEALMSRHVLGLFADITMMDNAALDREMATIKDRIMQIVAPPPPPPPPPPEPEPEPKPATPARKASSPGSKSTSPTCTPMSLQRPEVLGPPPPQVSLAALAAPGFTRPGAVPPPPIAAAPQRYTAKPVPQPSKKMKQLFWDTIPYARLHGTFWVAPDPEEEERKRAAEAAEAAAAARQAPETAEDGDGGGGDEEGGEGPPTLDWSLIEEMFAQVLKARATPAKASSSSKQAQSVIDSKRAYNISILMGSKIKIPVDALRARVVQLDPRAFDSEEAVGALLQCVPSADDAAALAAYRDSGKPLEDLGDAERVCLQLMSVPLVEQRLRVYSYKFQTPHKLASAKQVFSANLRAIEAMLGSRMFHRALRLARDTGNFMNFGTRLGNAIGFRLRMLPRLQDTKSADGKHTLLSALALEVMRVGSSSGAGGSGAAGGGSADGEAVLSDEMGVLADSMLKVSHAEAGEMLSVAEQQIEEIRGFLSNYIPIQDAGVEDTFAATMSAELEAMEAAFAEVRGMQISMKEQYEGMLKYFGENLNSTPSDTEFWAAIASFVDKFSATQKALLAERKEKEEREARRRQREAVEAEKLKRVTKKRLETAEVRERLLAGGRTPSKPHSLASAPSAPSSHGTNALNAAASAAVHAHAHREVPATPTQDSSAAGISGPDAALGLGLVTPLTGIVMPGESQRSLLKSHMRELALRGDDDASAAWPLPSPLLPRAHTFSNTFDARLSEAGFGPGGGSGSDSGANTLGGTTTTSAGSPEAAVQLAAMAQRHRASHHQASHGGGGNHAPGLEHGAAVAAGLKAAAAGLAAATAHSHGQQAGSGGGGIGIGSSLPPLAPRPAAASVGGVGPHALPTPAATAAAPPPVPLSEAERKAAEAARQEREVMLGKERSNKQLASILCADLSARARRVRDEGEGAETDAAGAGASAGATAPGPLREARAKSSGSAADPLQPTADGVGSALTPGDGGLATAARHVASGAADGAGGGHGGSADTSAELTRQSSSRAASLAGWLPDKVQAEAMKGQNEDRSIYNAVQSVIENMLDDLVYGTAD